MPGCCAYGCSNNSKDGFLMHKFPLDPKRRAAWAHRVSRKGWEPTNNSVLCSAHFVRNDYEQNRVDGRKLLKRSANIIPSIFTHRPLNQCKERSRRLKRCESVSGAASQQSILSSASDHNYALCKTDMLTEDVVIDTIRRDYEMAARSVSELSLELSSVKKELQKERSANQSLNTRLEQNQQSVTKIFNEDQLNALSRLSSQGMKWSDETVKTALRLCFACGPTGYQTLLSQNLPYPSIRTLQRRLQSVDFQAGIVDGSFHFYEDKG